MVWLARFGLGAGLAGAEYQPAAEHGIWAILHQLPRLRGQQPDLCRAQEYQGRARTADGVSQPGFFPGPDLAEPSSPRGEIDPAGLSASEAGGQRGSRIQQIACLAVRPRT